MRTRKIGGKRKKEERKRDGEERSERSEGEREAQGREEGEKHPCLPPPNPSQPPQEAGRQETKTSAPRLWLIIDVFLWGKRERRG